MATVPPGAAPQALRGWSPLCSSADVGNRLFVADVGGPLVAACRASDGRAVVTSGRCPHLGASLEHGWVEDDRIVCALHRYEFDLDGSIALVPPKHLPPPEGLERFRSVESAGIVWFAPERSTAPFPSLPTLRRPRVTVHATSTDVVQTLWEATAGVEGEITRLSPTIAQIDARAGWRAIAAVRPDGEGSALLVAVDDTTPSRRWVRTLGGVHASPSPSPDAIERSAPRNPAGA